MPKPTSPTTAPDVAILGAGFAGTTAARELSLRGRTSIVLEARDRLGGRTHSVAPSDRGHDDAHTHSLEYGGTWIHPCQPHVWAEITRYGLELTELPLPGARQAIFSNGKLQDLSIPQLLEILDALGRICEPAAALYPAPYTQQGIGPDPDGHGRRSVREHLAALELPRLVRDGVDAFACTLASAPLDRMAVSELMRVFALAGYTPGQMFASLSGTKLARGTGALVSAIARDARAAEFRLGARVERVEHDARGVRVALAGGEVVAARAALVTLPANALDSLAFGPALSAAKRAAAREGHAGRGVKLYAQVAGDVGNLGVFAPESEPINWVATVEHGPGGSLLVVFGHDPARFAGQSPAAMQRMLERLVPGVQVERVLGWDWTDDPLARGTWSVLAPGQPARQLPEALRRSEGRLFFASGDSAIAWRGFIDGAIESAYRAAREIDAALG